MLFQGAKGECTQESTNAEGLQEAINGFQQAQDAKDQIPDANIDNKTTFYLGRAYLCQSLTGVDRWQEAEGETQKVIAQYDEGDNRFKELARGRVAEAHANLGMIYLMGPKNNLPLAAQEYLTAINLNRVTVDSGRWLDFQALLFMKLAVIYECVPDYAEADKAWDESIRYEALWYKQSGEAAPIPSPFQTLREDYARQRDGEPCPTPTPLP